MNKRKFISFHTLDNLDLYQYNVSFVKITEAYNQKQRHYHDCQHIQDMLEELNNVFDITKHERLLLAIAVLYHDIVYNPTSNSNKLDSMEYIDDLYLNKADKDIVKGLIKFTEYKRKAKTKLEGIMMDLDLNVFRKPLKEQIHVAKKIMLEYNWVSIDIFVKEQCKILKLIDQLSLSPFTKRCNTSTLIEYLQNKEWRVGIYIGYFNPCTIVHQNILEQAQKYFDKIIVGVLTDNNYTKYNQRYIYDNYECFDMFNFKDKYLNMKDEYDLTIIKPIRKNTDAGDILTEQQLYEDKGIEIDMMALVVPHHISHIDRQLMDHLMNTDKELAKRYFAR